VGCEESGTLQTIELLTDGSFETGTDGGVWFENDIVLEENPSRYPDGDWGAWLGGADDFQFYVSQDVSVPAGAIELTLSGQILIAGDLMTGDLDVAWAAIYPIGDNDPAIQFTRWTPADATSDFVFFTTTHSVPNAVAGEDFTFDLVSDSDSDGNTNFFVDDVSLIATGCMP
jgi:hypothetical protein